ncbi:hypothetical protein QQF64_001435 [Cirrhinus molitorella]|uniref:Uncharacterized protein n=1 Tax=Cirrhinus molitorella TaxID=172907 RepID=A0ABR3P021_9TELE
MPSQQRQLFGWGRWSVKTGTEDKKRSRRHLASTTCEPFIEEVTLPAILCHIDVTTLSVPGHGSLSQMN